LKQNQVKAARKNVDDETPTENEVQKAEDEVNDQEVAGPSRVPEIVVDTEAATASPILPQKKKSAKNKENARTTAEISDADPEFRQPEKISRLDDEEIEVDRAYNSEDDFMSPMPRTRRNQAARPDLTSTLKTKTLSSKKKMSRKRISSSSSSTSLKEIEKTVEPVSSSKTATKNNKRRESKNPVGDKNLSEIEEEYEEELVFDSPPRRQSRGKRNSLEDFVVEKEKRKPSRSQERDGKNEKKTTKSKSNTEEVAVEVQQVRRRSTRNSMEGVKGDQATVALSPGNSKKTAVSDKKEKSYAAEAKKNSNRRKLVESSSQELKELKEKAKKSARYDFQIYLKRSFINYYFKLNKI
jgi:hypothetical protein